MTRRGLRIYQKEYHITDLGGKWWDVASQGMKGVLYRVSFADVSPMCECVCHTAGKEVQVQAYGSGRTHATHIVRGR